MILKTFWLLPLAMLYVAGCSDSTKSNPNDESTSEQALRIMTYNIHHANPPSEGDSIDIDAVAEVIRKENPDLVALQEVDVYTERSGENLHQARALAQKLDMHFYFAKALNYQNGFYGNAVLSKFPILDSMRIELPPMEGVQVEIRNWTGIKVAIEGKEMWFGSTHLDFQRGENNLNQAKILLQHLESVTIPVFIGGDFNRPVDSETIELFDTKFQRTCTDCPPTIPVTNPDRTIDHLMYRPKDGFRVTNHRVIDEQYASDHLPVVADVYFK